MKKALFFKKTINLSDDLKHFYCGVLGLEQTNNEDVNFCLGKAIAQASLQSIDDWMPPDLKLKDVSLDNWVNAQIYINEKDKEATIDVRSFAWKLVVQNVGNWPFCEIEDRILDIEAARKDDRLRSDLVEIPYQIVVLLRDELKKVK